MHEYSIIAALIDRVQKETAVYGEVEVRRLHVRIGELSGVEIELLETAFETFRERTLCGHADLEIEIVPPVWSCPNCRSPIARGAILRCEACDRPAKLLQGDEIVLQRIEMEAPNV